MDTQIHDVDVVLPVHNEEASIGGVLREFYAVAHGESGIDIRLVIAEDGSRDNTRAVIEALAEELPIYMLPEAPRKGYSRAVLDGLLASTAPLVAFSDSDGQCHPGDLVTLIEKLGSHDIVAGYRNPRNDAKFRMIISGAFRMVFERCFPVRLRDPSCPFVLIRREAIAPVLRGNPGLLRQGFWWEFNARAAAAGLDIVQTPVRHRVRAAGQTQVYRLGKLPGIATEHLKALFALRVELRSLGAPAPVHSDEAEAARK